MDIFCFSHLRWNFVFQRPQHLLKRFAKHYRVFFWEEPIFDAQEAFLEKNLSKEGVWVLVPHLPGGLPEEQQHIQLESLLKKLLVAQNSREYISWYYTPLALLFTRTLMPKLTLYDCMDELSAFKNAPPALKQMEKELLAKADIVFTGGYSLYEAKKGQHPNVHAMPSSIDVDHFSKARAILLEPLDQYEIALPKIGFFGVVDERMDIAMLDLMAQLQPAWQFIIIGPIVKIDPKILPQRHNIHFLGGRSYDDLPAYLSGWDVAMMPFAMNESTRFISPTKTPEYLAGGKPVVSTPIRDVVTPYGENKLVAIANSAEEFISAIQQEIDRKDKAAWLDRVDTFLASNSWDMTARKMMSCVQQQLQTKQNYQSQTEGDPTCLTI